MTQSVARRLRKRVLRLLSGAAGRRHSLVGAPHLWRRKRQFQIDFLRAQGLRPHHHVLDLGCGTLRGGIPLIEYLQPGHYTGVDVRREALEEGREELRKAGLEEKRPRLVLSDDFATLALDPADYVWAFSVLIHMPDAVLDACIDFVARHLAPGGCLLGNVNVGEEGTPGGWQGFPVVRHPWSWYEALATKHGLRIEDLGSLADLGDRDEGRLPPEQRRMVRLTRA